MSTIALNNLAEYILSLGLSQRNRKWLAERLTEPETKMTSKDVETLFDSVVGKWQDNRSTDEIVNDIYSSRKTKQMADYVNPFDL